LLLAILIAAQVARIAPRPRFIPLGVVLVAVAVVLYRVTPRGVIDLSIGIVLGAGAGLAIGGAMSRAKNRSVRPRRPRHVNAIATIASIWCVGLVLWVGANDPTVRW
jgi:hypothetical protein